MDTTSILQIVSGFKPDVNGVGDFARQLGNALLTQHSIKSHYLVYRRPQLPLNIKQTANSSISYPSDATPPAFLSHLEELKARNNFKTILLHYGPYAYSSSGTPRAFGNVIEGLATENDVIIYFHELYASGRPWRRAFWTERQQKQCVRGLMTHAKVCVTSNAEYLQMLEKLNFNLRPLVKLPVISGVGEPKDLIPLDQRAKQIVVFGQPENRARLYKLYSHTLAAICRMLALQTIVDVGTRGGLKIPNQVNQIPVKCTGWVDDEQLSDLLASSTAGVIAYWPDVWEKSSVMAAYQAHAMVPVLVPLERRRTPTPAFVPYVVAEDLFRVSSNSGCVSNAIMQSIADAGHCYYVANQSVRHCAAVIASYV